MEKLHLFLMAGQSNMAGRGIIGDVPPIEHRGRIFMLRNGRFQPMSEPINPDRQIFVSDNTKFRSGIGLAASFAESWICENDGLIGLIPCADGGSSIKLWQPGEILFDNAIMNTQFALRTPSVLDGIIWHQGETESKTQDDAKLHKQLLKNTIDAFRSALNIPGLPFVMGELAWNMPRWPYTPVINAQMKELTLEVQACTLASAEGYEIGPDHIHFTAAFYREFGRRYYLAYKSIL